MLFAAYDTETTGLFHKSWSLNDKRNPHVVQLAVLLCTANGIVIDKMNRFIKPDGWTIDPKAQEAHGISLEHCETYGVPFKEAAEEFNAMLADDVELVAHNEQFDRRLLMIDYTKHHLPLHIIKERKAHCTMLMSSPLIKMPPTAKMKQYGFTNYKPPKLQEAYMHFNEGKEFEGAHDAMNDCHAVIDIFFKMRQLKTS